MKLEWKYPKVKYIQFNQIIISGDRLGPQRKGCVCQIFRRYMYRKSFKNLLERQIGQKVETCGEGSSGSEN